MPAPAPGERPGGVTVFPNPYRVEARWDVGQRVRDHYLWFANLPRRCTLRIYTLAGDRVFETRFEGSSYRGEGARGLYDPRTDRDVPAPFLSGATYAWNMITSGGQAAATGLYIYSVEDLDSGQGGAGQVPDREERPRGLSARPVGELARCGGRAEAPCARPPQRASSSR